MTKKKASEILKDIEPYGVYLDVSSVEADVDRARHVALNGTQYALYTALEDIYYRFVYVEGRLVILTEDVDTENGVFTDFYSLKGGKRHFVKRLSQDEVKTRQAAGVTVTLYDTVFIDDLVVLAECDRLLGIEKGGA